KAAKFLHPLVTNCNSKQRERFRNGRVVSALIPYARRCAHQHVKFKIGVDSAKIPSLTFVRRAGGHRLSPDRDILEDAVPYPYKGRLPQLSQQRWSRLNHPSPFSGA